MSERFILITRPESDAVLYKQELEHQGFSALVEPMLVIQAANFEVPDLSAYQALIFTSANGVNVFAETSKERETPVYSVGKQTKDSAYQHGYETVYSAEGTAEDLGKFIESSIADKAMPLLHVRGGDSAYPLSEALNSAGYTVDELVVYEGVQKDELSAETFSALENGHVQAVTFFSKRTAEAFMGAVDKGMLSGGLSSIKALCISETVLNYVRQFNWQGTYAAHKPDRDGMTLLVQQQCQNTQKKTLESLKMSQSESTRPENGPIENATEVIERFGGIRPLAKKIDVAVTTVQGWKKRDVIPAARRAVILEAAETYNVDLTDILPDAPPANENQPSEAADEIKTPEPKSFAEHAEIPKSVKPAPVLEDRLADIEKTVVNKHTWFVVAVIGVILIAIATVLWPSKVSNNGELDRLSALEARTQEIEGEVAEVKDQQSFFGTLIPEDLDQQLASIQEQAGQAKEQLGQAVEKAKEVSGDVLGEEAGTVGERVVKLEGHLQDMNGGSPVLAGMLEKVQGLSGAPGGQSQIDTVMSELSAMMGGLDGQPEGESNLFESTLDSARGQSDALGQTFDGVPATDLKAAAMLLAMTQFRSSLNRDNEAFGQDFNVLMGLVGEENLELRSSLERLAPHAEEGVLTPGGLTGEFKTLAGEAVVASLAGEDVSVTERAQARFNEVFQVEKNGELITGTDTQVTVNEAEKLLENGDLEGAIGAVQMLDGPAAAHMAGWLKKAQTTLMAQNLKQMIGQTINMKAYGGAGGITAGSVIPGSSTLIRNEETGINILRRNTLPGMPNLPKDANPYR